MICVNKVQFLYMTSHQNSKIHNEIIPYDLHNDLSSISAEKCDLHSDNVIHLKINIIYEIQSKLQFQTSIAYDSTQICLLSSHMLRIFLFM